jgi:hypothetical protein
VLPSLPKKNILQEDKDTKYLKKHSLGMDNGYVKIQWLTFSEIEKDMIFK